LLRGSTDIMTGGLFVSQTPTLAGTFLNMEVVILVENANRDESRICWICRGQFAMPFLEEGDTFVVDCCNCGDYKISKSLRASRLTLPDSERYRFSFWGKQQQLEKREPPVLSSYTIDGILAGLPDPTEHGKPDILLRSLSLLHPKPSKTFTIDTFRQWSLAAARDMDELAFHVRTLVDRGDLKQRAGPDFQITGPGWARIGQMSPPTGGIPKPDPHVSAVLTATALTVGTQVASHGQVGGITAHTVNVGSPPPPEAAKHWWEKWWVFVVGLATIAGAVFGGLEYWDSHHHREDRAADHPPATPLPQTNPSSPQAAGSNSPVEAPVKKATQRTRVKANLDEAQHPPLNVPVCQDTTNSNCAQNNYGQQVVIGYVVPLHRVISPEKMSAAIAALQSAPEGSKVRINYAAENGDAEIEPFFKHVTDLFLAANHWQVETERIGRSMNFADGGTLTGEGIGCSASGDIGTVAKKAMDISGFPCMREPADWGIKHGAPADIVISIGSRIIPPK
jgi:hypothetical protein